MKQDNSNSDEFVPINFQPMPKRFKVWSMRLGQFLTSAEAHRFLVAKFMKEEPTNVLEFTNTDKHIIIQSTNLFDQDGKEIFEGSILEQDLTNCRANRKYHYLVQSVPHWGAGWMPVPIDGGKSWPSLVPNTAKHLKNVGHILSNPELLKEEKC